MFNASPGRICLLWFIVIIATATPVLLFIIVGSYSEPKLIFQRHSNENAVADVGIAILFFLFGIQAGIMMVIPPLGLVEIMAFGMALGGPQATELAGAAFTTGLMLGVCVSGSFLCLFIWSCLRCLRRKLKA
jgi:hypothetical protein